MFQALPPFKQPSISKQQFLHIHQNPSPTSPSSPPIFTPNSINSFIHLLPLPLPYNPTALPVTHQPPQIIPQPPFPLLHNIKNHIKPTHILTPHPIHDPFPLHIPIPPSTNTLFHTLPIPNQPGIHYHLQPI
ncbi:dihydroxy-acid dehydratase domain-containing protein, partial [Staphylococcus capitis]|uniref:dihydroxy-acid dehydratase domain-containing protein n=1 Tax=Staphylococcus capitis TaxID=29388 RepID=UPI0037094091